VVLVAFPPIAHDRYTCFFFEREQDPVLLSGAAAVNAILYFF
jgi:hypothetical protein